MSVLTVSLKETNVNNKLNLVKFNKIPITHGAYADVFIPSLTKIHPFKTVLC